MSQPLLDVVPLFWVYLGIIALFFLFVEVGLLLGRWHNVKISEGLTAQTVTVLGALLSLNGFLLGFSFSAAGSQFDVRRTLVIQDVNAIDTAFLLTETLPEPQRSTSRRLLAEYVERRHMLRGEFRSDIIALSNGLHDRLWAEASVVAQKDRDPVSATYLNALGRVFDIHSERANTETWVRIPGYIFFVLVCLSLLSMTMTGYLLALRKRRYGIPTALMVLAYATTLLLVIDLDRPVQGLFNVSQAKMIELRDDIHAQLERESPAEQGGG